MADMKQVWPELFVPYRVESFAIELLDREENIIPTSTAGRIGVTGGTITASVDARIKTAGSLNITADDPTFWWGDKRIRVYAQANKHRWNLGVFLPNSPSVKHTDSGVEYKIDLLDKLTILDEDVLPAPLTVPQDTKLSAYVEQIILDTGETNVKIQPSTKTNRKPLTWDAGTPKLTVINDILDYIGYFSLTANRDSQFTATPYTIPAERPITWFFGQDEHSMTSSNFTITNDITSVPNRTVYIVQSASTVVNGVLVEGQVAAHPYMRAEATDTDPNSKFSYQARGRWITKVVSDAEAETQDELQKMAQRGLENAQDPMLKAELSTALFPVQLNELAKFTTPDYAFVGSIRKFEITLKPGSLMKITVRRSNYAVN